MTTDKQKLDSYGLQPLEDLKRDGDAKEYMIRVSSGTSGSKPVFLIQNKRRDLGKEPLFSKQFSDVRRIVFFGGMHNARLSCAARFLFYLGDDEYKILALDVKDLNDTLNSLFKEFKPEGLIGFPSFISKALSFVSDREVLGNIKAVRFSGEMLSDAQKEFFAEKIPQATLENIYASAEVGYMSGVSCGHLAENHYHPYERVKIEIINQDEGGVGDLVVSYNLSPSIHIDQYETGDVARFLDEPCKCGNPVTFQLLGRRNMDFIRFLGVTLLQKEFERVMEELNDYVVDFRGEAREIKVGDETRGAIALRILPKEGFSDADLLRREISERLFVTANKTIQDVVDYGLFLPLEIEFVDELAPLNKPIKIRRVD